MAIKNIIKYHCLKNFYPYAKYIAINLPYNCHIAIYHMDISIWQIHIIYSIKILIVIYKCDYNKLIHAQIKIYMINVEIYIKNKNIKLNETQI